MARHHRDDAAGPYQLLLHVPKRAVADRLLRRPQDLASVDTAYRHISGRNVPPTRQLLTPR